MPILPGTDGVQKMSKSLGNYVALEEPAQDMYGKVMSLPDSLIMPYYEYLTDVPDGELAEMRRAMASDGANPMDFKKGLARHITATFHDAAAAAAAQSHFEQVVQRRDFARGSARIQPGGRRRNGGCGYARQRQPAAGVRRAGGQQRRGAAAGGARGR